MKIIVIIPSEDYRHNAGARIRYGGIVKSLAVAGHQLVLEDINGFDPLAAECDVAIISKCHDARALMCARVLRARGSKVGIDLFDDYFSQTYDSRMTRYRDWLAELLPLTDFVLCSTPVMAGVARLYEKRTSVHVMNDPIRPQTNEHLSRILLAKGAAARENRTIDLCWFGMGDNPHFRVGLSDLAAFGSELALPSQQGFNVRLKVLTNARALDADGLALLSRLPVPVTLEEWTPRGEAAALTQATACILPVNAQHFSTAKSLNRAVTALSAGCQVVSLGYPLYAPLKSLIYRDLESLAIDIGEGQTLLRAETAGTYASLIKQWASPQTEASGLAAFLSGHLGEPRADLGSEVPPMAILHGTMTSGAVHKFSRRLGALAVRTPFCIAKLDYDILFAGRVGQRALDMFVTGHTVDRMLPRARDAVRKAGMIGNQPVWALSGRGYDEENKWSEMSLAAQLSLYAASIKDMRRQLEGAFGSIAIILSESSYHPFSARVS
jgi:hypothetical protein